MFWQRTVSSTCIISALVGSIFWAPGWIFHGAIGFFATIGLMELVVMFNRKGWGWGVVALGGGLIYVGLPYLALCQLYQGMHNPGIPGTHLVGFVLLVTKGCDIGAYLVGSAIGRRPFVPAISPKKTIEGSLGGLAVSLLAALVSKLYLPQVPGWQLAMVGLGLGILAQVGDLFESILKRVCHVKDSGWLFPGLGGALDAIDSVLFTAPAFYLVVRWA